MPKRLNCCVPFCRHTRGERKGVPKIRRGDEWICSEHWRGVSKHAKTMKRRWERKARRTHVRDKLYGFMWDNVAYWWWRCKAEAIDGAAGLR